MVLFPLTYVYLVKSDYTLFATGIFFCALLIRHLLRQSLFHLYVQFHAVRSEPPRSEFLESRQFVIADVVPFILGKAI